MPEPSGECHLVELSRAGDQEAARKLFDEYVERLIIYARAHISQRLASRIDPEDVVQSVFRTFFGRLKNGNFHVTDEDDLCRLLVRITAHKTLRQIHFHQAAKRDARQEQGHGDPERGDLLNLLAREPSPEITVAFLDHLEHFLSRLRPQEREILELRVQGFSNQEIADRLGIYDRKIRRVLERIRGVAEREGLTPVMPASEPDQSEQSRNMTGECSRNADQ
jgi:RNA polymerase sigma factor (sigma-70 family)